MTHMKGDTMTERKDDTAALTVKLGEMVGTSSLPSTNQCGILWVQMGARITLHRLPAGTSRFALLPPRAGTRPEPARITLRQTIPLFTPSGEPSR